MANMKTAGKKNAAYQKAKPKPRVKPEYTGVGSIDIKARPKLPPQRKPKNVPEENTFKPSPKQMAFIATSQNPEYGFPAKVLYGGAGGGGKTWAQCVDAFLYGLRYPASRQVIFRRTFPELERSIIVQWLNIVSENQASYNASQHIAYFKNGSMVEFAHLERDETVYNYKSSEYDVVRFDEASEFSEFQLTYMASRCRGVKNYPRQVKYSTNPGGRGHKFLKKLFRINEKKPLCIFFEDLGQNPMTKQIEYESRVFIPALVTENKALMDSDPGYISRLMQLPEKEREALLHGNWDLADDAAFREFERNTHVCKTFIPPEHWRRWRSVDNGFADPFAWYWYAVSEDGIVYVYREYTREPETEKILYSDQAREVLEQSVHTDLETMRSTEEKFQYTAAGHDAWQTFNGRDVQGKTLIDHYAEGGLRGFVKAITDRRLRCAVIHEYLKPFDGPDGRPMARVQIMDCCTKLIETFPEQLIDPADHEKYLASSIDHQVDSFGYGILSYHASKTQPTKPKETIYTRMKREAARKAAQTW